MPTPEPTQPPAKWVHIDGTECVAGHDPTAMLCLAGGGPVQAEIDWLRESRRVLLGMLERMPDTHMQFGLIHPDGTREELPCADWCWACRVEHAEATVERARDLARHPHSSHGMVRNYVPAADLLAALEQPAKEGQ